MGVKHRKRGTATMKSKSRTPSASEFPDWYLDFQKSVLQSLPRPDEIEKETLITWSHHQSYLGNALSSLCRKGAGAGLGGNSNRSFLRQDESSPLGLYIGFQADVLKQLPRPGEITKRTAEAWMASNSKSLCMFFHKALTGVAILACYDKYFKLFKTFTLEVPEDYNHATQLSYFLDKYRGGMYRIDRVFLGDWLKDSNFANVSTKLQPGMKFEVDIFELLETVSTSDCLNFLKVSGGSLVGVQGATIVFDRYRNKLTGHDHRHRASAYVSFDEKKNLYKSPDGNYNLPEVGGRVCCWKSSFHSTLSADDSRDKYYILRFREIKKT